MKRNIVRILGTASVLALIASHNALAQGALDSANTYIDQLDASAPIHIHPFTTEKADLGWGASGPQGEKGTMILGDRVAKFLTEWAR